MTDSMSSPKIVIVGAGIAGLCAGVYARKSGFEAEIVEMASSSGGLATSWKRQQYTFETCLHWLLGSNPASPAHSLWQEVFDIGELKFVDLENFAQIESSQGQSITLSRNLDLLEKELRRVSPKDTKIIQRLVRGMRKLSKGEIPLATNGIFDVLVQGVRMVPYLPEIRHWSRMSVEELGAQFENPLLKRLFSGDREQKQLSALALVLSFAWMSKKDAGYPIGGSQAIIRLIEKKFRELGGTIRFNSSVDRILVENDQAVGVHLRDGHEIQADWVVSAADGHSTLFDWIPSRYRDRRAADPYKNFQTFPSYIQVSLGMGRDLSREPAFFTRVLDNSLDIDPKTSTDQLTFRVFHFDPSFAPAGKTAVTCFIPTRNYAYWLDLSKQDPQGYALKKAQLADAVIEVLDQRTPGLRQDVEVIDVSTPATVIRQTGNWKGSMEGFLVTPQVGFMPLRMNLPGLKRLMMIGQWVMPGGGLPSGLMTGRRCIQSICRTERRKFYSGPNIPEHLQIPRAA